MAKLIKLINYAYVKDQCDLPENLEDKEFNRYVYRAQEVLRMVMGDDFYQDYKTNFEAGTLSAVYTSLQDYIDQYLAWQVHEYWVPFANLKKTRAGFRVHTEANSQAATDVQMAGVIKDAKYQSQYYKELLIGFLKNHSEDYPLYENCCGKNVKGNAFHVSAVKNKHKSPQPYGTGSYKCCHD